MFDNLNMKEKVILLTYLSVGIDYVFKHYQ